MTTRESEPPTRGTRGGDSRYTWEDTIAAIGKDYSGGKILVADERVEKATLARYCEVFELSNPIHWDEEVARRAGYKSVVVPWAAVKDTWSYGGSWRPGEPTRYPLTLGVDDGAELMSRNPVEGGPPMPPTNAGFFTDMTIEFFEPVCLGDNLIIMGHTLAHVRPRETRVGVGAFVGYTSEYYNQRGELVARNEQGSYSYNKREAEIQR